MGATPESSLFRSALAMQALESLFYSTVDQVPTQFPFLIQRQEMDPPTPPALERQEELQDPEQVERNPVEPRNPLETWLPVESSKAVPLQIAPSTLFT